MSNSNKLGVIARFSFRIKSNKNVLLDILIISLVGLLAVTWFKGNFFIKTGDDFFPLNPVSNFYNTQFFWLHFYSTGLILDSFSITNLPFFSILSTLNSLGFSVVLLQQIFYYAMFTLSGISAYFLSSRLLPNNNRLAGLASALFYMMNPYSLSVVWFAHYTTFFFTYAIAPLFLFLFIKGVTSKRILLYALSLALIQVVFSPIFDDPSEAVIILLFLPFMFLIGYIIIHRHDKKSLSNALRFTLLFALISVIINMWWILPNLFLAGTRFSLSTGAYSSLDVFVGGSGYSSILNSLRLLGFYFINFNPPMYAWTQTYSSQSFLLLSSIIPITAFGALFLKGKNKFCIFFSVVTLVGLFLSKGAAEPLGSINLWLFQNVPLAVIFRTHFERFGLILALGFAFLIGITMSELWAAIKRAQLTANAHNLRLLSAKRFSLKAIALVSIFLALSSTFTALNYPFINGDVIFPGSKDYPSARIQVPEYYSQMGDYINAQTESFRIMDVPPRLKGTSAYAWENGYIGSDPLDQYYIHKPLIGVGYFSDIEKELFGLLPENTSLSFAKTLALMNCKYLLIHRDFNSTLIPALGLNITYAGFQLEQTFGKLDLYINEYWEPVAVYSSSDFTLLNGNFLSLFSYLQKSNGSVKSSPIFLSSQLGALQQATLSTLLPDNSSSDKSVAFTNSIEREPQISYTFISPTKLSVYVNASNPYFLVFSDSYNTNWIARIDGQEIDSSYHFIANGYANCWYINKTGSYTVTLEFWPQNLLNQGIILTLMLSFVCLCITMLYLFRYRLKKTLIRIGE